MKKLIDNEISEGWFIEYKEKFPKSKKIANSIASFANSEGGWYIVGIKEEENQSGPRTNIVKDLINPIPYIQSKIIKIPDSENVVLVVYIPEGNEPPYISNGSVYIRAGETSKPLAIEDRYYYDKLINKAKLFKQKRDMFVENNFTISQAQDSSKQPFLECYIYLDNPNNFMFDDFYSEAFFNKIHKNFNTNVKIISEEAGILLNIELSNHYSSIDSHIFRHIGTNNSLDLGLTLELFKKGHLKFVLPFHKYSVKNMNTSYENLDFYESLFSDEEKEFLTVIDCAESIAALSVILEQYKRLLNEYDFDCKLYIKLKFKNFWRVTPYFDDKNFLEHLIEYGLPINLKDELEFPPFGEYIILNLEEFDVNQIFLIFLEALGFPFYLKDSIGVGISKFILSSFRKQSPE